jgi:tetratricopeptide (TPR) repeat protein
MSISATFLRGLQANLAYWQRATAQLASVPLDQLGREQLSIIQAVRWGLRVSETRQTAVDLTLQASYFAERTGHWQDWLPVLPTIAIYLDDPQLCFQLYKRQGQLLRLNKELDKALTIHQKTEALAIQLNDQAMLAEAYINLSDDHRLCHHYEEAEQYGCQALELLKESGGWQRLQSIVLLTLGLISHASHRLAEAEQRLRQAEAVQHLLADDPVHLARIFNVMAIVLQEQGKFEMAADYCRRALAVLAPTAGELDKSKTFHSLGTLYIRLEQYDKAEEAFRQADSEVLHRSGDLLTQAALAQNQGTALMKLKRFDEAHLYLRRSQKLWQQLGDQLWLANTLSTLADLFDEQGQWKSAVAYFDEAISLVTLFPENERAQRWQTQYVIRRQEIMEKMSK